MSESNAAASETATSANNGANFVRADGKKETNGQLTIIKAKELEASGKTGVIAQGTYVRSVLNRFGKKDYIIATDNGDLLINGTGSLDKQMALVQTGELVQISYTGSFAMKEGAFKGKKSHVFVVRRASSEA